MAQQQKTELYRRVPIRADKEIRVLELLPAKGQADVSVNLNAVALSSAQYEALSYS